MRKHKYRVWSKIEKQYYYINNRIVIHLDGRLEINDNDNYVPENFIIEEYTTFNDKSGVEIFEGDRIRFSNGSSHPAIIKFKNGAYVYEYFGLCYPLTFIKSQLCEIIGHIHEEELSWLTKK